jgi:ATP-dependent DNA helicase RecG
MTATPIPRTLALAFYGDLDLSMLDEMPLNRQKIITEIITPRQRDETYDFIKKQVSAGRQVFVVCPLIEKKEMSASDTLFEDDRKSAIKEYEKLSKIVFPKFKVGLVHGKLKSCDKAAVMQKFQKGQIDILVATAVVEVGIDIPNASVMMIESAERFGLAQLHQFRGRVGRGEHQSYCFLFSESQSQKSDERLSAMTTCNNGFELAEIDLRLRGPGEFTGIRQSGLPDLKMASLSDRIMIEQAKAAAQKVVNAGIENTPAILKRYNEFYLSKHLE